MSYTSFTMEPCTLYNFPPQILSQLIPPIQIPQEVSTTAGTTSYFLPLQQYTITSTHIAATEAYEEYEIVTSITRRMSRVTHETVLDFSDDTAENISMLKSRKRKSIATSSSISMSCQSDDPLTQVGTMSPSSPFPHVVAPQPPMNSYISPPPSTHVSSTFVAAPSKASPWNGLNDNPEFFQPLDDDCIYVTSPQVPQLGSQFGQGSDRPKSGPSLTYFHDPMTEEMRTALFPISSKLIAKVNQGGQRDRELTSSIDRPSVDVLSPLTIQTSNGTAPIDVFSEQYAGFFSHFEIGLLDNTSDDLATFDLNFTFSVDQEMVEDADATSSQYLSSPSSSTGTLESDTSSMTLESDSSGDASQRENSPDDDQIATDNWEETLDGQIVGPLLPLHSQHCDTSSLPVSKWSSIANAILGGL
ncbi:hypothetical protein C8Q75DRAFT_181375 [Abortiporus biennis]|nr:hypothetical protein C8Q75DRAFT_181375 [Abortiporus biennis]